jgi:hypothetical protein
MNATTVAADLAKNVFELAVADEHWKVTERAPLSRGQFERWFDNRAVRLVVMNACARSVRSDKPVNTTPRSPAARDPLCQGVKGSQSVSVPRTTSTTSPPTQTSPPSLRR